MPTADTFDLPHAPLIIDVAGLELSSVDRQRLRHPLVGGMVLFGRNWHDREQLSALCADIKSVRSDLLILVEALRREVAEVHQRAVRLQLHVEQLQHAHDLLFGRLQ